MTFSDLKAKCPEGTRFMRHPEGDGWIAAHDLFAPAWHRESGECVVLGPYGQLPMPSVQPAFTTARPSDDYRGFDVGQ